MQGRGLPTVDIVMLGSFGVWTRGTLQSRALPLARAIASTTELRLALVTTPWDDPAQAGVQQAVDGVKIYNTRATEMRQAGAVAWEQCRLLHGLQPRLVHVLKPKAAAGLTADLLARTSSRTPIIVDYDDWEGDGGWNDRAAYPALARRLFAYQERRLIRVAQRVTAASTTLEERAARLRGTSGDPDVVYLPNGLDQDWMNSLRSAGQHHRKWDAPRLLLYSRFAEFSQFWLGKLLREIDRALSAPVRLDIVGKCDGMLISPGDLRWIQPRLHGYVERSALPGLLGSATIALYPYADDLINRSKQSVKLLELMASGCAVVANDVGDVRRIGGPAVSIHSAGDTSAFARAIVRLILSPERAAELGHVAQQRAAAHTTARLASRLLTVYQSCGLA